MTNKNVNKKSQVSKPKNRLFLVVADHASVLRSGSRLVTPPWESDGSPMGVQWESDSCLSSRFY